MTGRQDRSRLTITFLQDDVYEIFYRHGEVNYCPAGMEVVSVTMTHGGRKVQYRSLVDNLTIPCEAFYAASHEDIVFIEQYKKNLEEYIEYRNGLIAQGHKDLRKP